MARMARHTQSWTRIGLGPGAKCFRSRRIWVRRAGSSFAGTWVERSYVICKESITRGYSACSKLQTFPRRVMAAKRVASGSASDCRIPIMVAQESFCVFYNISKLMRNLECCSDQPISEISPSTREHASLRLAPRSSSS